MKFNPKDFYDCIFVATNSVADIAAKIANQKLQEWLRSYPLRITSANLSRERVRQIRIKSRFQAKRIRELEEKIELLERSEQ